MRRPALAGLCPVPAADWRHWRHSLGVPPQLAEGERGRGWTLSNLSIHGHHLFVNTADAHLLALDARTGAVAWDATDLGCQDVVDVDPRTGRLEYRPGMIPELDVELDSCPSCSGFKSWRAMAYGPATEAFHVPVELTCVTAALTGVERREGGGGFGLASRVDRHHPPSGGNLGELVAMHRNGRILSKHRQRTPFNHAALTMGGGLVFVGDWNRHANACDAETGELPWQTRLRTSVQGFPISHGVGGRRHVAIPVGVGALAWARIPLRLTPAVRRPEHRQRPPRLRAAGVSFNGRTPLDETIDD